MKATIFIGALRLSVVPSCVLFPQYGLHECAVKARVRGNIVSNQEQWRRLDQRQI
jgi:hypothetical protein